MSVSSFSGSPSLSSRRTRVLALVLALTSTATHAVGAGGGGDRGLLYLAMAATCAGCAVMTFRHDRVHDWFVMGLVNATMISAHVLLMNGASGEMAHLSLRQHLVHHLHGQGFDVAHVGAGLAALELVLCLSVLVAWAVRPSVVLGALPSAPQRGPASTLASMSAQGALQDLSCCAHRQRVRELNDPRVLVRR